MWPVSDCDTEMPLSSVRSMPLSDCNTDMPLSSNENSPDSACTFTVALDIINSVTYFGGRVQINVHQCKRLVDFYERARQFFDALKKREVSVDEKRYNDALDVLIKGQYLIYGYLKESWIESMKTDGVNQDAFAKIYVELEDCFRLIYEKSEVGVVGNYYTHYTCWEHQGQKESYPPIEFDALAPLFFLDEDCRATLFEGDAQKDKEHMLEMMKRSGALDNEEGLLKREPGGLLNIMKEALAKEMLRREQVEEELMNLYLVQQHLNEFPEQNELEQNELEQNELEQNEFEQNEFEQNELDQNEIEQNEIEQEQQDAFEQELLKQEEPAAGEDSIQEVQEVPEVLDEMKVSSSKDTGLPQDFKIRSTEICVLHQIGSGGFATIYKCQWQNNDYAVKIFEGGDVNGLRAEVQNLVLLPRHPNIVLLVGFSIHKTDGKPMLVMELLDGDLHNLICSDEFKKKHQLTPGSEETFKETLVSRLRKGCCLGGQPDLSTPIEVGIGSTPIGVAIDFIYQIAGGMLFLHNRKIFHGDLKCTNVLVKQLPGGSVQLKITDFGVSEKLLIKRGHSDIDSTIDLDCSHISNHSSLGVRRRGGDGKARVHGNVGTLRWMAPEVYGVPGGDIEPYSMKADVYSFAMTCVEILTEEHPFPDRCATRDLKAHVQCGGRPDLSKVKDVPKSLRELVEMCWDADPLQRPDFSDIYSRMKTLKMRFPIV